MIRVRRIAIALMVAAGAWSTVAVVPTTTAVAAEQKNAITTKAVAEPLKKVQAAIAGKQWSTALAELKNAQAVEKKTPYESYAIDQYYAYIYAQQGKLAELAPVLERMINSGFTPPENLDDQTRALAHTYFKAQNYNKAIEWARKSLERNPNQQEMHLTIGQSQFLLKDYQNAAATMMKVVANAERAGAKPDEQWLQIAANSYFNMDDRDSMANVLKKLVRYYPSEQYWDRLLTIYRNKDAKDDSLRLGYYRLMDDVGVLKNASHYVEMAQLAMDAGVPGEAEKVVSRGVENGTLKTEDKTEQGRYDRLLSGAKKLAAEDRGTLEQLAKEAEKATGGQADVALGHAYLSYGRYDEAIAAIQRGIKKGSLTDADEAHILLGIAYIKKGQKDQARQAFRAVKDNSKWTTLSDLWEIRTFA